MENARQIIYAQDVLLSVKRSAWVLYQHGLTQIDLRTHRRYTPRKALSNVLRWMAFQRKRVKMAPIQLDPLEKSILQLMVTEGLTRKQVAYRLNIPDATIKYRLAQIRASIGVSSTHQVVAIAVEYGLVGVPELQK